MSDFNGQYGQALASLMAQLQQAQGNADLVNRPTENGNVLPLTTIGSTGDAFSSPRVGNFNTYNENGDYIDPNYLVNYGRNVLNGAIPDYRNLQVGNSYSGANALDNAVGNSERMYDLQNTYNALMQMSGRR